MKLYEVTFSCGLRQRYVSTEIDEALKMGLCHRPNAVSVAEVKDCCKSMNEPPVLPEQFKGPFSHTMGKVFIKTHLGDTNVLDIRGWGYLTGTGGGLAIKQELAAEIQDQFAEWVVHTLNAALP